LDLALQDVRGRLRRGSASAEGVWLVVASDGRGNVPLEASLGGELPRRVDRTGVDDALRVAGHLRLLAGTRRVVLAPPDLTHQSDLPFALAEAMAGMVADISGGT
jgi:magnesium chelatase subunit D